jgi:lipopolysaccharide transport system permease protein
LSHIFKTIIEAAHNFLVYVVVAIIFFVYPGENFFWLLITIPLCLMNVTWMAFMLAIVSTRFRDVPMIVQSAMGVLFWLTPIIYYPEQLGDKALILQFNPLYHLLDVLRLPILNQAPTLTNLVVCLVLAIAGWIATIWLFAKYRSRIPFWL